MIEAGAIVLPCDGRGQLYQLGMAETFAKPGKERIRHLDWGLSHGVGVFEDEALQIGKIEIGTVAIEVSNLLFRDPALSANGRTDVNSKWTADERRDTQFGKAFQFVIDELGAHLGLLHLKISPEEF